MMSQSPNHIQDKLKSVGELRDKMGSSYNDLSVQVAYKEGYNQAIKDVSETVREEEQSRIESEVKKLFMDEDSICNFEDRLVQTRYGRTNLRRAKSEAKELEGAYNGAVEDALLVIKSLTLKHSNAKSAH